MNSLIETIFQNFTVDNKLIPVSFMRYNGKSTTYITYMYYDSNNSYSGDNELLGWVDYYDFDIYSKGNYLNIIESVKSVMKQNGFMFQPSRSSADMYEYDTGYFHRTLSFAIERQENEVIIPSL